MKKILINNASVNDALQENWSQINNTVAWAVKVALIKRGRFDDLQLDGEETRKELEDETLQKVVKALHLNWRSDGGASPATFASKTAQFAALKAVDALIKHQNRFGTSLDAPVKSNSDDDNESQTYADITSDKVMHSSNLDSEQRISVATDLRLIRDMLSNDDWNVFIRRYEAPRISNRQLAEELGWSEDRLRWFLKGYEKRLSRLLGMKRPDSL